LASIGIMLLGAFVTPFVTSISGVWEFIMQCGAGLGLVLILRWYWWRVNAWSEIAATLAPLIAYSFCQFYLNETLGDGFINQYGPYYFTVGFTTLVWITVTFLTPKPTKEHIEKFDERVRPMGVWPSYIQGVKERNKQLKWLAGNTASMIVFIISFLFAIGSLILMEFQNAVIYVSLSIISVFGLKIFLKKTNIFGRNSEFK